MTATATRPPRLPALMPVGKPKPPDLQAQFDVLAEALTRALDMLAAQHDRIVALAAQHDRIVALAAQHDRIVALEAKIALPKPLAAVEQFAFVLPATKNAPARRCFDAAGFLSAIAERQR